MNAYLKLILHNWFLRRMRRALNEHHALVREFAPRIDEQEHQNRTWEIIGRRG